MRMLSIAFICVSCAALVSPALAEKDKDRGHGGAKAEKHDDDRGEGNGGRAIERRAVNGTVVVIPYQQIVIVDRDRDVVRTYYRNEYVAGRCPPGLAMKNNGCLPPGQANGRVWVVGQPLPSEIVYYPISRELWTQLTPPPYGYEYVRVNSDILVISTSTRLIAGLLGNLGNFGD